MDEIIMIKVGESRKWSNNSKETFEVLRFSSFFIDDYYYVIKYSSDGFEQTVSEQRLLKESIKIN